jgi:hypothetical protein
MMKQYWTPLARVFGLYEQAKVGGNGELSPSSLQDQSVNTHWPELFEAFRRHALDAWLPLCKRHAEVNPKDKLLLQALTITPFDPEISNQLTQWSQEGSTQDLILWLVKGPWNVPDIHLRMDFSEFETLSINGLELQLNAKSGMGYDWRVSEDKLNAGLKLWQITEQTRWVEFVENPPQDLSADDPSGNWQALIEDALSVRRLPPLSGLMILGQEKTVRMPNGQQQLLKDRLPFQWEQQTAMYVAVHGAYVSGLHLALRASPTGVQCQDLNSTNGSFIGDQRLVPGEWTTLSLGDRIFLGGHASDVRSSAPSLEVSWQPERQPVSEDATPLRHDTKKDVLQIHSAQLSRPALVMNLPFLIGRDPQCDWVVGAHNLMVSRMHLRIEQIDYEKKQVLVRDTSRQGLTQCAGGPLLTVQGAAWVPEGAELVLGKSGDQSGLVFRLSWSALTA